MGRTRVTLSRAAGGWGGRGTVPVTRVTAVILAYGDEPWLESSVSAVLASQGVEADVVLVDNGCTNDSVERFRGSARITVVDAGENLGFAGGCNRGAEEATGEVLALVNGDACVAPDALARLVGALDGPDVAIASGEHPTRQRARTPQLRWQRRPFPRLQLVGSVHGACGRRSRAGRRDRRERRGDGDAPRPMARSAASIPPTSCTTRMPS